MRTFIASTAVLRIGSVALLQRAPLRISKAVARALIVAAMLIVGTARADTVDDTIRCTGTAPASPCISRSRPRRCF